MTTAIITLLALAVFHFVYESIVAPSLRLSLRLRLFDLRDEVEQLKTECVDSECVDSKKGSHCEYLQDSIDGLISRLHRVDVASLLGVEFECRKDPDFLAQAQKRARILDDCPAPRVREIRKQTLKIAAAALIVNSGAWVVLLFAPWALVSVGYSESKKRFRVLASLNSREFKRISLAESGAMAPI
jgi:hypothetical protein